MRPIQRFWLVGTLPFVLYGCGGGGSSLTGITPDTRTALERGTAQLNQVAGGQEPTNPQSLKSIFDLFNEAIAASPNTSVAHFGAAIALTGLLCQEADGNQTDIITVANVGSGSGGASGGGFGSGEPPSELPPSPLDATEPPRPVPPHHTLGLFWYLDRGLSNPLTLLNMLSPVTDLRFGFMPFNGYWGNDTRGREEMLTKLDKAIEHLKIVEADLNFTFQLNSPDHNGQPVTVGLPEVHLFHAYVESLRVETALSLAYTRSLGDRPPLPPTISNVSAFLPGNNDANSDGKLSPNEYLAPSPFLTLRDANTLQIAKQAMLNSAEFAAKGIAGVLARPTDGNFLISNNPEMQRVLVEQRDKVLPLLRQATEGAITVEVMRFEPMPLLMNGASTSSRPDDDVLFSSPGELPPTPPSGEFATEQVTFTLAAWFNAPPADLKAFAPTYPIAANGWPHYDQAVYPDLNFGGLFPNGLPSFLR